MTGLTKEGCLNRQSRLCKHMESVGVDGVVVTDPREIAYFTGAVLPAWPACFMLMADQRSWLLSSSTDLTPFTDDYLTYEPHTYYTNNPDNQRLLAMLIKRYLVGSKSVWRIGWQAEYLSHHIHREIDGALSPQNWIAIDDVLADMESRKDVDEIALIRRSIQADLAGYAAAQSVMVAGANELEVLSEAQKAANLDAGEPVYHGGDFSSGSMAGSARNRSIENGELYIIDAQTVYRGYWCDLARTYVVGGNPNDLQTSIQKHIATVQTDIGLMLRPGLKGTEIWKFLDARIREHPALSQSGLVHHGGHGVGLRAHEAPDVNRDREGTLAIGNVISIEPGGYTEAAHFGVRIENMYLITENGAENLSDYPTNLVPNVSH